MRTMGSIPSSFFAANVKKLCLTISVEPLVGTQILSTCTGLDSLALWVDFWSSDSHISVPPLLAYLPLRNLSVPLKCFHELSSDVLCRSTLLQNLVRLDLIHWDGDEFAALPDLSSTPNLTELGVIVHFHITKSYLLSLSSQCPTLRVMSVLVDEGLGIEHVPTEDPRIVFLPYPNMVPDWEASVRGFESTWTAARQVVAERLREINLSSAIGTISSLPFLFFRVRSYRGDRPSSIMGLEMWRSLNNPYSIGILLSSPPITVLYSRVFNPSCLSCYIKYSNESSYVPTSVGRSDQPYLRLGDNTTHSFRPSLGVWCVPSSRQS